MWAKDIAKEYNPDAIRYFFITNGPEKRDTDFSWREFKKQNRTLAFAVKYLNSEISAVTVDNDIIEHVKLLYDSVGEKNRERCFQRGS